MTVLRQGSPGGVTSIFMRGGESDYVQVLVDGVPINQPGGAFDFAHLRTEDVERVEIVRGPVSVLYGSDAVTGVIHVVTRKLEDHSHMLRYLSEELMPSTLNQGDGGGSWRPPAGRHPRDVEIIPKSRDFH